MSIYKKFFNETVDENGKLLDIEIHYPDNFNFGYDVIDAIAAEDPDKRALVWCNTEGEEHVFFLRRHQSPEAIASPMCCWLPA